MHYEARLSDIGLDALRDLLGVEIHEIFCPAVEVRGPWMLATSFSILLPSSRYLVLSCDWLETPLDFLDYYQLSAAVCDEPAGIKLVEMPGGGSALGFPVSCIRVSPPVRVERIGIHTMRDSADDSTESVQYDGVVSLQGFDGTRIAICAEQTIAGLLELTLDQELAAQAIANSGTRLSMP